MSASIQARGLNVQLGGREILHSLDLDVRAGEWLTIIGPNGAGKTTLLKTLAGVLRHDGDVRGVDEHGDDVSIRDRRTWARLVGYLPQSPLVPAGLSVVDYVLLGRTPHHGIFGAPSGSDLTRVERMLRLFDLVELAERPVSSISGGEAQRAALARVMVQDAPILMLDEPTTGLDIGHQQELLDLLKDVRMDRGSTIVTTLHDLTTAGRHGDRLVLVDDGRVAADGTPAEVLTPNRLFAAYGARVDVVDRGDGPVVIPQSRNDADRHRRRLTMDSRDSSDAAQPATTDVEPPATDTPPEEDPRPALRNAPSLVVVNTGDGKGKSSSAFGMMCRGVARGWNVAVVQYLKSGSWSVGEEKVGRQLGVDWWALGEGFTWDSEDLSVDQGVAMEAWRHAKATIEAGEHELVILDEITYPMNWGWIDADEVISTIANRPAKVNVVCTGRDASDALVDLADTVTEMRHVKHAYDNGIAAKRGLDY